MHMIFMGSGKSRLLVGLKGSWYSQWFQRRLLRWNQVTVVCPSMPVQWTLLCWVHCGMQLSKQSFSIHFQSRPCGILLQLQQLTASPALQLISSPLGVWSDTLWNVSPANIPGRGTSELRDATGFCCVEVTWVSAPASWSILTAIVCKHICSPINIPWVSLLAALRSWHGCNQIRKKFYLLCDTTLHFISVFHLFSDNLVHLFIIKTVVLKVANFLGSCMPNWCFFQAAGIKWQLALKTWKPPFLMCARVRYTFKEIYVKYLCSAP